MSDAQRQNLLELDGEGLERFFVESLDEKRFRAHQAGCLHPGKQADHQYDGLQPGPHINADNGYEHHPGNGGDHIDKAHHQAVDSASVISADRTDQNADGRGDEHD